MPRTSCCHQLTLRVNTATVRTCADRFPKRRSNRTFHCVCVCVGRTIEAASTQPQSLLRARNCPEAPRKACLKPQPSTVRRSQQQQCRIYDTSFRAVSASAVTLCRFASMPKAPPCTFTNSSCMTHASQIKSGASEIKSGSDGSAPFAFFPPQFSSPPRLPQRTKLLSLSCVLGKNSCRAWDCHWIEDFTPFTTQRHATTDNGYTGSGAASCFGRNVGSIEMNLPHR